MTSNSQHSSQSPQQSAEASDQLMQFLQDNALPLMLPFYAAPQARPYRITPIGILDAIKSASEKSTPFSILRMGDGEGWWLERSALDEAQHRNLFRLGRKKFCDRWFNDGVFGSSDVFQATTGRLRAALARCTVLAAPTEKVLRRQYERPNLTSSVGIVSAVQFSHQQVGLRDVKISETGVNHVLVQREEFWQILRNSKSVNLIAPHEELPELLMSRRGVAVESFLKTPSSRHNETELPVSSRNGHHYPNVFQEITQHLEAQKNLSGSIWILAAGMLGKIYGDIVYLKGGIVLDLGSVVDGWIGVKTRPFIDLERSRL